MAAIGTGKSTSVWRLLATAASTCAVAVGVTAGPALAAPPAQCNSTPCSNPESCASTGGGSFNVGLVGTQTMGGTTTFTYRVCKTDMGDKFDLSHWVLGLDEACAGKCDKQAAVDPTTGLCGVKFETGSGVGDCTNGCSGGSTFSISCDSSAVLGNTSAGVSIKTKAGQLVEDACVKGPLCSECDDDADCADGDACTDEMCDAGKCKKTPKNCDDTDVCTTERCDGGTCRHDPIAGCCKTNDECEDANKCTDDKCVDNRCSSTPTDCTPFNLCEEGRCDPDTGGCVETPIDCDDHLPCTTDTCVDGKCVNTPIDCDDKNVCTTDRCNPDTGKCENTGPDTCCTQNSDCDDRNACTTDTCRDGQCRNERISCDDNQPCTNDRCRPLDGGFACDSTPEDCTDSDPCTTDSCDRATGDCKHEPIVCDDKNPCTTDTCFRGVCRFEKADLACSTAGECNDFDSCTTDQCIDCQCRNTPRSCRDTDPCTKDSCVNGVCRHEPLSECCLADAECEDGDPCTHDTCVDGECHALAIEDCCNTDAQCDDGNLCTRDSCSQTICLHPAVDPAEISLQEQCSNGQDDDCDGQIDCVEGLVDADCRPCPRIKQDPARIVFGPPGEGLDLFQAHGRFKPPARIDPASEEVFILLSNTRGRVYAASLIPGDWRVHRPRPATILDFQDPGARRAQGRRFGLYSMRLRYSLAGTWYFRFRAYGDLSAADDPNMLLQLQIGDQGFISTEPWVRTANGWRSRFTHLD